MAKIVNVQVLSEFSGTFQTPLSNFFQYRMQQYKIEDDCVKMQYNEDWHRLIDTHLYASKHTLSLKISSYFNELQFISFISKTLNFGNLNVQAELEKPWLAWDTIGI